MLASLHSVPSTFRAPLVYGATVGMHHLFRQSQSHWVDGNLLTVFLADKFVDVVGILFA